jgi:hypothetical protein
VTDSTTPLRKLVEALYIKTIGQELVWSYNSATDSCEASVGAGYVSVIQETDEDGDYYSYLQIKNSQSEVVDSIYGGTLGKSSPFNTGHHNYWELIKDLRAQAYRSAMGSDKVVSSMLVALNASSLKLDDEIPF